MVRVGSRYLSSLFVLALAAGLAVPARAQSDKPAASNTPAASARKAITSSVRGSTAMQGLVFD